MRLRLTLLLLPLLRFFFLVLSGVPFHGIFALKADSGGFEEFKNATGQSYVSEINKPDDLDLLEMLEKALANYDGVWAPRHGHGPPVVVQVKTKLLSVPIFLEKDWKLLLELELDQEWQDARLVLNTSRVIDLTPAQALQLWQPHVKVMFPYEEVESVLESHQLRPNSTIRRVAQLKLSTWCPFRLHDFPFHRRHCNISIGSFVYSTEIVVCKWANVSNPLEFVGEASNFGDSWTFPSLTLYEVLEYRDGGMFWYSRLKIEVIAYRDPGHYLKTYVIPLAIVIICTWIPYYLKNNRAAGVNFGVGMLGYIIDVGLDQPRTPRASGLTDIWLHYYYCCLCIVFAVASWMEYTGFGGDWFEGDIEHEEERFDRRRG